MTGEESVELLKRSDHPVPAGQEPMANLRVISPGYLSTMGIDLLSGRDFSEEDRRKMRVVILSRKAAQDAFPDGNVGRFEAYFFGILFGEADFRFFDGAE